MAFPNTPILDSGVGADQNPLNTGFETAGGGDIRYTRDCKRVSNQITNDNSGGNDADSVWNATFTPGTIEQFMTVATEQAGGGHFGFMKCNLINSTATVTGYQLIAESSPGVGFYKISGGGITLITSNFTYTALSAGDVIGWDQPNSGGVLTYYRNGSAVNTRNDTTYQTQVGYIGMGGYADAARYTNFGGGVVAAASTPVNWSLRERYRAHRPAPFKPGGERKFGIFNLRKAA